MIQDNKLYNMRVRVANNIITLYNYELGQTEHNTISLKQMLYDRFVDNNTINLDLIDFASLNNALKLSKDNINIDNWSDKTLINYLDNFKFTQEQFNLKLIKDLEHEKNKDFKILKSNFNAKKDRFIDLVNANLSGNCFFITLTYDNDNILKLNDLDLSHKRFKEFNRTLSYHLHKHQNSNKYVCTWELQKKNKRDAIHYHMFLFDTNTKKLDLTRLNEIWSYGSINVKRVKKGTSGIGKYMSKYLLKDLDDLVNGKKSYFSSKNLIRPYNDYVLHFYQNKLILKSGEIIDLTDFDIEQVQEYNSAFTGQTKKIIYNREL